MIHANHGLPYVQLHCRRQEFWRQFQQYVSNILIQLIILQDITYVRVRLFNMVVL